MTKERNRRKYEQEFKREAVKLVLEHRPAVEVVADLGIRDEMLEDGVFGSFEDAHTELFEFIEAYYNRKRIHSSIDGIPPVEFETKNI